MHSAVLLHGILAFRRARHLGEGGRRHALGMEDAESAESDDTHV